MWVTFPLNDDAESIFLLDRNREPYFSQEEIAIATTLLRGIHGFHRQLLLSKGLTIAEAPLSPTARRIVSKLLTGMSEKEIASAMGQSANTTHKYIKSIYEQFGVQSRAGTDGPLAGGVKGELQYYLSRSPRRQRFLPVRRHCWETPVHRCIGRRPESPSQPR